MSTVRIALANIRAATTPDESVALVQAAIERASVEKAAVVCFPECYVPGYRALDKTVPAPTAAFLERAWSDIAETAAAAKVGVVLGTERLVDGVPRITVLVIDRDGTIAGFQDKIQLDPSEESIFSPGAERQVFRIGPLTFGVVICHEGWRYPETVRWSARRGAHVVFHPHFGEAEPGSYRPKSFADPLNTFHEKAMLCRAAENTCYFASVNCASDGSPTTSAVVRPDGTVLAWQPYGEEGLLVADIDTAAATGLLAARCRDFERNDMRLLRGLLVTCTLLLARELPAQVRQVGDLNTRQIRALDRSRTVVILQGGMLEEHGPYLPAFTDGLLSARLTSRARRRYCQATPWMDGPRFPACVGRRERLQRDRATVHLPGHVRGASVDAACGVRRSGQRARRAGFPLGARRACARLATPHRRAR